MKVPFTSFGSQISLWVGSIKNFYKMLLSIIIPVYNVEKYVEKCIRSCENQDIPKEDYEVIVVNDGSPDGSLAIVERVAKEYPNIKVISQENGGLSSARNTGMRNACGEYYMFVDSDDWIAENCLGKITAKLRDENPDALAMCDSRIVNGERKRMTSYPDETPMAGRDFLRKFRSPCAQLAIWKAEFFKEHNLRFFKGIYHEDAEFTPRAYYLADKVSFTNDIIYHFYPNPTSITRTVNPKRAFDLVEVVCPHLSEFAKGVNDNYKDVFYYLVGRSMNTALHLIQYADKDKKAKLNAAIIERSYLWNDIRKSNVMKYKIEAYLNLIFKSNPLKIYRVMQLFNKSN